MKIQTYIAYLSLMLIGLKLANLLDWSWWWVLTPFWLPLSIAVLAASLSWFVCRVLMNQRERAKREFVRILRHVING